MIKLIKTDSGVSLRKLALSMVNQSEPMSAIKLIADYSHWLDFVLTSQQTILQYDRQLTQISERYPDLSEMSDYLQGCMHHRCQFLGSLAIPLRSKVAQLRASQANAQLIQQLTHAHPVMQVLIERLAEAFAELDNEYRILFPLKYEEMTRPASTLHQHQQQA